MPGMAQNKTQPTTASVEGFLEALPAPRRAEALKLLTLLREVTGHEPVMWGATIVGFGQYHYHYESGRQGDAARLGFSVRKSGPVVYIIPGFEPFADLMARLGKYTTGSSCLYLKSLADVDFDVLRALAEAAWAEMARRYPT